MTPLAPAAPPRLRPGAGLRVPGSTSNLGPGFDQLGLALELFLEVEVLALRKGQEHRIARRAGTARDWPEQDELMTRAFDAVLARAGAQPVGLELAVRSEIPLRRGLGSSGAAIAAGLHLANDSLGDRALPSAELARIGTELDGHPDNVCASLRGGCTLGVPLEGGGLRVLGPPLHESLAFAVAWGPAEVETSRARAVLPSDVSLGDVVWNLQRLSLLLAGLASADPELLRQGCRDRLHSAARLQLVPGGRAALAAAEEAGAWLATISGSGSALVAAHADPGRLERIAEAMARELAASQGTAEQRVLSPCRQGPRTL